MLVVECDDVTSERTGGDVAKVVVLESWYGGSHRAWLDGWRLHSRHDLHLLTLPDRFWRWRLRGGAVELAGQLRRWVDENGAADAVVISGLVDGAGLVGLARRSLGGSPAALYLHENQLLYPLAPNQRPDIDLGLISWRSMLAADAVWWNSKFHHDALLDELPQVLDRQPEPVDSRWLDRARASSTVLWPGVELESLVTGERNSDGPPLVLWNQRWDHDKNPRAVFAALAALASDGVDFGLALAGENQGRSGVEDLLEGDLAERIAHRGWLDRPAYQDLLLRSDVVVSAADHEFFGIAIVEALAAGAVPVLPDRLSFPELVAPQWHGSGLYADGELRRRLGSVLTDLGAAQRAVHGLRESMLRFDVRRSAADHDLAVDRLITAPR